MIRLPLQIQRYFVECLTEEATVLHSPSFYLEYLLYNLNYPPSALLFPYSVKRTGYLAQNVLKIA